MVVIVNNDNFEKEVIESDKKVLVDFNADWCGPCQMLKPIIEEFSDNKEDVKVVSINVDDNQDLAFQYNVFSIPCLILFENKKEKKRNVGLISLEQLEDFVGE